MTNHTIKNILIKKGVTHLYHANTVATACTFLEQGGLLSRGMVRDLGLFQTPQETDASDQIFDVFYDIFFDSVDIHRRSKNVNYYGPVTFVFSIDLLDSIPENTIKITKDNPKYWANNITENEKYFQSPEELISQYSKGNFRQHLTIQHQMDLLSFDYLDEIILDDPRTDDFNYFSEAYNALQDLVDGLAYPVPLTIRRCNPNCNCISKYRSYSRCYIKSRFSPN